MRKSKGRAAGSVPAPGPQPRGTGALDRTNISPASTVEDPAWPLRRVVGQVGGRDLLECGHRLPHDFPGNHYRVLITGRRCPRCFEDRNRNADAELRALKNFVDRVAAPRTLLDR